MVIHRKIRYTKGALSVIWQPHRCVHSFFCTMGLPGVFNIHRRPWIMLDQADEATIIEQVERCPSGALSYILNPVNMTQEKEQATTITLAENGPLLVKGTIRLVQPDGSETLQNNPALCRCGGSQNKPFCDGTHRKNGFKG